MRIGASFFNQKLKYDKIRAMIKNIKIDIVRIQARFKKIEASAVINHARAFLLTAP
jgi:hypothetical protein